jgi:hypothetical protein
MDTPADNAKHLHRLRLLSAWSRQQAQKYQDSGDAGMAALLVEDALALEWALQQLNPAAADRPPLITT